MSVYPYSHCSLSGKNDLEISSFQTFSCSESFSRRDETEKVDFIGHKLSDRLRAFFQKKEICNALGKPLIDNPNDCTLEFKYDPQSEEIPKIIKESLDLLIKPNKAFVGFQGLRGGDIIIEFTYRELFSYLKERCSQVIDIQLVGSFLKKKIVQPGCRLALFETAFNENPEVREINKKITLITKTPRDIDFRVIVQKELPPSEIIYLIFDFLTTKISKRDKERLQKEEILLDSAIRLFGILLKKNCRSDEKFAAIGIKTDSLPLEITVLREDSLGEEAKNTHYGSQDSFKESLFGLIGHDHSPPFLLKIDTSPFSIKETLLDLFLGTTTLLTYDVEKWSHHLLGNHSSLVPKTTSNLILKVVDHLNGSWDDFQKSLIRLSAMRGQEIPSSLYQRKEYERPLKFLSILSKDMKKLQSDEEKLFFLFRACQSLHSESYLEETFYENVWIIALKELELVSYAKKGDASLANALAKAILEEKISFSLLSSFVAFLILSKDPSCLSNDSGSIVIHEVEQIPLLMPLDLPRLIDSLIENFKNRPLDNSLNTLQNLFKGKAFDPNLPYPFLDYLKTQTFCQESLDKIKTLCEEAYPLPLRSLAFNALLQLKESPPLFCLKELPLLLSTFSEGEQETLITRWKNFSREALSLFLNDRGEFQMIWPLPLIKSPYLDFSQMGLDLLIQKRALYPQATLEAFDFFLLKKPEQALRLLKEVDSFEAKYPEFLKKLLSAYLLKYEKNPQAFPYGEAASLRALLESFFVAPQASRDEGPSEVDLMRLISLFWRTPIHGELADSLLYFLRSSEKKELCKVYPTKFEKRFLRELYLKEAIASFEENNEKNALESMRSLLKEIKSGEKCSKEEETFLLNLFKFSKDSELFREEDLPLFFLADHYSEAFIDEVSSNLFLRPALTFCLLSTRSFISLMERFSLKESEQWIFIWNRLAQEKQLASLFKKEVHLFYKKRVAFKNTFDGDPKEIAMILSVLKESGNFAIEKIIAHPEFLTHLLALESPNSQETLLFVKALIIEQIHLLNPKKLDHLLFQELIKTKKNSFDLLRKRIDAFSPEALKELNREIEKELFNHLKVSHDFASLRLLMVHLNDRYKKFSLDDEFFQPCFKGMLEKSFKYAPKKKGENAEKKIQRFYESLSSLFRALLPSYTLSEIWTLLMAILDSPDYLKADFYLFSLLEKFYALHAKIAKREVNRLIGDSINEKKRTRLFRAFMGVLEEHDSEESLSRLKLFKEYFANPFLRDKFFSPHHQVEIANLFLTRCFKDYRASIETIESKGIKNLWNQLILSYKGLEEWINQEEMELIIKKYHELRGLFQREKLNKIQRGIKNQAYLDLLEKLCQRLNRKIVGEEPIELISMKNFNDLINTILFGNNLEEYKKLRIKVVNHAFSALVSLTVSFAKKKDSNFPIPMNGYQKMIAYFPNLPLLTPSYEDFLTTFIAELKTIEKECLKEFSLFEDAFFDLLPLVAEDSVSCKKFTKGFGTELSHLITFFASLNDHDSFFSKFKNAFEKKKNLRSLNSKNNQESFTLYHQWLFESLISTNPSLLYLGNILEYYVEEKINTYLDSKKKLSEENKVDLFHEIVDLMSYFTQIENEAVRLKGERLFKEAYDRGFFKNDSQKKTKSGSSLIDKKRSFELLEGLLCFNPDNSKQISLLNFKNEIEVFYGFLRWEAPSVLNFCNAFGVLFHLFDQEATLLSQQKNHPKNSPLVDFKKLQSLIPNIYQEYLPYLINKILDSFNSYKKIKKIFRLIDMLTLQRTFLSIHQLHSLQNDLVVRQPSIDLGTYNVILACIIERLMKKNAEKVNAMQVALEERAQSILPEGMQNALPDMNKCQSISAEDVAEIEAEMKRFNLQTSTSDLCDLIRMLKKTLSTGNAEQVLISHHQIRESGLIFAQRLTSITDCLLKKSPGVESERSDLKRLFLFCSFALKFLKLSLVLSYPQKFPSDLEQLPDIKTLENLFPVFNQLLLKLKKQGGSINHKISSSKLFSCFYEIIELIYQRSLLFLRDNRSIKAFLETGLFKKRCFQIFDSWVETLFKLENEGNLAVGLISEALIGLFRFNHLSKKSHYASVLSLKEGGDAEKAVYKIMDHIRRVGSETHILSLEFIKISMLRKKDDSFWNDVDLLLDRLDVLIRDKSKFLFCPPPTIFSELFFLDEDFSTERSRSIFFRFITIYMQCFRTISVPQVDHENLLLPNPSNEAFLAQTEISLEEKKEEESSAANLDNRHAGLREKEKIGSVSFDADLFESEFRFFLGEAILLKFFDFTRLDHQEIFNQLSLLGGLKPHQTYESLKELNYEEMDKELGLSAVKNIIKDLT